MRVKIVVVAAAAKPALGSLYDVAGLPDGLANQHRSTGLPGSAKQTTMGLFKSPWRSKVAAVAAFQSPEPPAEEFVKPPPPPPPPGRDAATIVEELAAMTDAVEAARVALARTGTIIPKMGFGDDLEAAEVQLDACEAKLDEIVRLGRTSAAATRRLGDAEKAGRRASGCRRGRRRAGCGGGRCWGRYCCGGVRARGRAVY